MMLGYHGQPAKTREAEWTSPAGERFIRTGDVGRFDDDGFLTLLDRKKDMVISGGFNIYPSDLEAVLREHPAVADVAVVGVPSEQWGETPVGFVVRREGEGVERSRAAAVVQPAHRQDPAAGGARTSSTSCRAARSARCSSANCASCIGTRPRRASGPAIRAIGPAIGLFCGVRTGAAVLQSKRKLPPRSSASHLHHARHRHRQPQGRQRQEHAGHPPGCLLCEQRRRGDAGRRRSSAVHPELAAHAQRTGAAGERADRRLGGRPEAGAAPAGRRQPGGPRYAGRPARLRPGTRGRVRRRHPHAGLQFGVRSRVGRRLAMPS